VQTTTVSINGSNNETIPSLAGLSVLTAEWAIEAEPIPASLEKAAHLNGCKDIFFHIKNSSNEYPIQLFMYL